MNEALRYVSEQATNKAATAAIAVTETVTMMRAARCPKCFRDYKKPPVFGSLSSNTVAAFNL